MNPIKDATFLTSIGSIVVNAVATSAGTVDMAAYEPRFSAMLALGSVHSGGSALAMLDTSADGTTWTNLGSITAPSGSAGSNTLTSVDYDSFANRYVRSRVQGAGAGGTVDAQVILAVKPRTVVDG